MSEKVGGCCSFQDFMRGGSDLLLQFHSIFLYLTDWVEGHGPRSGPRVAVQVHDMRTA